MDYVLNDGNEALNTHTDAHLGVPMPASFESVPSSLVADVHVLYVSLCVYAMVFICVFHSHHLKPIRVSNYRLVVDQ